MSFLQKLPENSRINFPNFRMSGQVKAEYDFEAQPGSGEMSISAGEILTVIRRNVEGGWMEGRNSRGQVGLFPESYVVPHFGAPPTAPPVCSDDFEFESLKKRHANSIFRV
ncbi:SH3 domain protein [Necator americanus]|uniref:SH3 domain protein n=1 Tax=Necator americanus TaxID=51031 RepID=W2TRM1_NECAM|nr:SH3 domain protein [Necator americanus]ETN84710.1 SH3 domain protein [Necator americanus]